MSMEQLSIVELETSEPLQNVESLSRRQKNAIKWLTTQDGLRPTIGGFRNIHKIEMVNRDSAEVVVYDIDDVLSDYDRNRKDEARMRAAQRTRKGQR